MLIAAFQRYPMFDDPELALAGIDRDLEWAEAQGIALAVFPECFLLGHSYDPAVIRRRARAARAAVTQSLAYLRHRHPMLVLGTFEEADGILTNSAIVIDRGRIAGRCLKAHPNEPGVAAGRDHPVFDHHGMRFGIAICNDANHPLPAAAIADQGADLICYPLNNMLPVETAARWRSRSPATLQARARQTGCWVASADVTGTSNGSISHGCTAIVAPDGRIVARAPEDIEGTAVFDIVVNG